MIRSHLTLATRPPSTLLIGLAGYWKLDGNGADALGVSTGSVEGVGGTWGTGKIGQSFHSPGGAARVNVGHNAQIKPTAAISVAGWFWFDSLQSGNLRCCSDWHQVATQDRWILGYSTDGTYLNAHMFGLSVGIGTLGVDVALNGWTLMGLSWSSSSKTIKTFRAGVQVNASASSYSGPLASGSGNVCIGLQEEVGAGIKGRVDEFAIWNRELTNSEWLELHNGGAGKPYPF